MGTGDHQNKNRDPAPAPQAPATFAAKIKK
jgi:hypothetical protein